MREIKFRGKRLDNEEWVHGDLLQIVGGFVIYHGSHTDSTLIEDRPNIAVELYMDEVSPVYPDTVGQFTGIKDKNCREIYEHDLIECGGILCEVVFNSHIGSFSLLEVFTQQLGSQPLGVMLDMFHASLKGNIHDNPELLKGGQNGQAAE